MTILLDITLVGVILTHHTCHIPYPDRLSTGRVTEDNMIGNLLFTVLCRCYMNRCLLVDITDTATHRGDTLSLQFAEEQLLTDAIGLQPLTVNI